jgi:hypothetical protein
MLHVKERLHDVQAPVVRPFILASDTSPQASITFRGHYAIERTFDRLDFVITIVRPSRTHCCDSAASTSYIRRICLHLATPSTLGQGNVYSYAQVNEMQLKQIRKEEEMVVSERREAMENIYRYGGVMVGGGVR